MRRMHVIDSYDRMGGEIYYREDKYAHDPELLDAYLCGKKDGWRAAMHEAEREEHYHERHYGRTYPPMMREHDHDWGDDYSERRRDSRGRYM